VTVKQSEFSRELKRLRTERGLTQVALAAKAALSARLISDLERGAIQTPQQANRQKLADAFELVGLERDRFLGTIPPRRGPSRRRADLTPTALPVPATPLVNREHSVAAVAALLRLADVRLVTLVGPVGVGKTRLSLAVADKFHRAFADGIWFVDLAAVDDAARLAGAVAAGLGLRLPAGRPPLEALAEQLRERRVLLILDNLEQMEAGPILVALLQMTTRLKLLATSRRSLRVRGEHQFTVRPLAVPDPADLPSQDELANVESVALFVQCVRSDLPDFRLTATNACAVAEICARLDGLPLAIELAASRIKIMSPEEMVPRLQSRLDFLANGDLDLPDRQRSLRAAIAWSCELLPDDARQVFHRLAVFIGGATLPAVEAVCAGGLGGAAEGSWAGRQDEHVLPHAAVWGALEMLVDASLVRREELQEGEVRFTLLQTIREWAWQELTASGEEAATRARHAAWAVDLAEQAERHLFTAEEAVWLGRLRREQDNLGAALEWTLVHDGETALRLAGAMADAWYLRGQIAEGAACLRQALEATPVRNPARIKALVGGSILTLACGALGTATSWAEEALVLARELYDRLGVAKALAALGNVVQDRRQYEEAFDLHRRALELFTETGDESWIANELCNLAWTSHGMDDDAAAASFAERLRDVAATTRDSYYAGVAQLILGDLALADRDPALASTRYREVFAASWRRGDRWLAADALVGCAAAVDAVDDPQRAARLMGAAEGLYRRLGVPFPPRDRPGYPGWRASIEHKLGEGVFTQIWAAGVALKPNEIADDAMTIAASMG
jgi:predicted ATPase/transcriptional regulator with XRE-family HTH domain